MIATPLQKTQKDEKAIICTVDYEGLTRLNISATQQLSKPVQKQQAAIDGQAKKITELFDVIKLLKEKERL